MNKLLLTIMATVMLSGIAYSQDSDKNIRLERRFGVSLKVMGTTWPVGISFDAFIIPQLNAEVNFIYLDKRFYTVGWGLKYHPLGGKETERTSPYIGIDFASGTYDLEDVLDENITKLLYFTPLGINYIGDQGFNISGDIGVMITDGTNNLFFMMSLKFGQRF